MFGLPLRLVLVTLVLVISVGLIGASGLTRLTIDRNVEAAVVADNANAAVRLDCLNHSPDGPDYSGVCVVDGQTGVVTLQLHKALGEHAEGFNPNAHFEVGGAGENQRVLAITNNSGISIEVWLSDPEGAISMFNESGAEVGSDDSAQVIGPGNSHEFYFTIDTPPALDALRATLNIREAD